MSSLSALFFVFISLSSKLRKCGPRTFFLLDHSFYQPFHFGINLSSSLFERTKYTTCFYRLSSPFLFSLVPYPLSFKSPLRPQPPFPLFLTIFYVDWVYLEKILPGSPLPFSCLFAYNVLFKSPTYSFTVRPTTRGSPPFIVFSLSRDFYFFFHL